jgi:subtilisin-like proprotein convertase family protein
VSISVDTSDYGDIAPGASSTNQTDFVVSIPADIPCGDPIQFSIAADYEPVSIPPTVLDFELRTGVVLGASQSVEPGLAIPDANPAGVTSLIRVSGSGATVSAGFNVDINITHTYIGDLIVRLISPGGTTVTLHNMSGGEAQNIIGNYPGTLTPYQSLLALIGGPLDGTWRLFISDNGAIDVGTLNSWGINDIQGYECEVTADAPLGAAPLRFSLSQNEPNPLAGQTSIRFSISRGDLATQLEIVDVSGRIVRTLVDGMLNAGEHVQVWDGMDDLGNTVGAGVYFYRLQHGSDSATRKLLMVR